MPTAPITTWGDIWRGFRVLILLPAAILVSAANDLRYSYWGQTTDAELIYAVRGQWKEPNDRAVYVEYAFVDATLGRRTERDKLPAQFEVPEGPTIAVRYIEGSEGASRVEENREGYWRFALVFLAIIVPVCAVFFWWAARESAAPSSEVQEPT